MLAHHLYHYVGDDFLFTVFRDGIDFHTANSERCGLPRILSSLSKGTSNDEESISKIARQSAKRALYLRMYGGGAAKLSASLSSDVSKYGIKSVPLKIAKRILDALDKELNLNTLKEMCINRAVKDDGFLYTMSGFRTFIPSLRSKNKDEYAQGTRQVFNYRIQGSAQNVMKQLMIESTPIVHKFGGKWSAQVHDEGLIYVKGRDNAEALAKELTEYWSGTDIIEPVPVVAEFNVGKNWGELH